MALVTRSRHTGCRGQWLRLLLAWPLVSDLPAGSVAAVALTEYEVKAGFLYHVDWFVEWPATMVQASAPTFIRSGLQPRPLYQCLGGPAFTGDPGGTQ